MIRTMLRLAGTPARAQLMLYLVIAVGAAVLLGALLVSLIPLVRAVFSGDPASAVPLLVPVALLGLLAALLEFSAAIVGQRLGAALILRMHQLIGERATMLPLGWFDAERAGAISHLTTRGVTFAANAPESILRPVLQAIVAPTVVGLAVLVLAPPVGASMLAGIAAVTLAWLITRKRGHHLEQEADRMDHEGAARVLEFASAQPAVRAAGPDSLAERSVREVLRAQRKASEGVLAARGRGMLLYGLIAYAAMLVTVTIAVALVTAGALDAPSFVAILALQLLTTWFAMHGLPFGEGIDLATRTLDELEALLNEPILAEPELPATPADASLEFDQVSFSYVPGTPVISDASFTIPHGSMTAIVGPSGSGKTTLARLMARFFDVDAGTVHIGGVAVRELGTRGVLAHVSMVFQDVYLFEDTLRENIRLGRPDASDQEVERVAQLAGVAELAARLPNGLDTAIGEAGSTLSGGERQRVSIARALLKDAPIVLLDEATAALDIENEALIQSALEALTGSKTQVVIAHRLQTIRKADQIIVLDNTGRVEAVGDHDTLLASSPSYAGFWADRTSAASWKIDAN